VRKKGTDLKKDPRVKREKRGERGKEEKHGPNGSSRRKGCTFVGCDYEKTLSLLRRCEKEKAIPQRTLRGKEESEGYGLRGESGARCCTIWVTANDLAGEEPRPKGGGEYQEDFLKERNY